MLEPDGQAVAWNPGAQRITGCQRDEIAGWHPSCSYAEADRAAGLPDEALAGGIARSPRGQEAARSNAGAAACASMSRTMGATTRP